MLVKLVTVLLFGCFFIFLGFFIWKKGSTSFIAGYKEMFTPKNEKKLAKRIGILIMIFGAETIVLLMTNLFVIEFQGYYYAVLAMLHLLFVFFLIMMDQLEF
jgi:hypothetical protein